MNRPLLITLLLALPFLLAAESTEENLVFTTPGVTGIYSFEADSHNVRMVVTRVGWIEIDGRIITAGDITSEDIALFRPLLRQEVERIYDLSRSKDQLIHTGLPNAKKADWHDGVSAYTDARKTLLGLQIIAESFIDLAELSIPTDEVTAQRYGANLLTEAGNQVLAMTQLMVSVLWIEKAEKERKAKQKPKLKRGRKKRPGRSSIG